MKDARGHGSFGRSGSPGQTAQFGIAPTFSAQSRMRSDRDFKSGGDQAVNHLRSQLGQAQSGAHRGVLLQGIRNLIGR